LYKTGETAEELQVTYKKGNRKTFKRNGKEYERLVDHIGLIPLIIVTPADTTLISEGSEIRRRFLDMLISQFDKEYLYNLVQYNKALKQRNSLLKQIHQFPYDTYTIFTPWNEKLSSYGTYIYKKRLEISGLLTGLFNEFYYKIAEDNYKIEIKYRSQLSDKPLGELLQESFEADKSLQYTTKGVHKDDLIFTINGLKLKKIASQGQQKTLLLALKLAEKQIIENFSGKNPLLLLDDVFDKLDENRVTNIITTLAGNNKNQIFITDTHTQRMLDIKNKTGINSKLIEITNSQITAVYE
jgi:DNA replication and repair protein RecF